MLFTAKSSGTGPEEAILYTQVCTTPLDILRLLTLSPSAPSTTAATTSTATTAATETFWYNSHTGAKTSYTRRNSDRYA